MSSGAGCKRSLQTVPWSGLLGVLASETLVCSTMCSQVCFDIWFLRILCGVNGPQPAAVTGIYWHACFEKSLYCGQLAKSGHVNQKLDGVRAGCNSVRKEFHPKAVGQTPDTKEADNCRRANNIGWVPLSREDGNEDGACGPYE